MVLDIKNSVLCSSNPHASFIQEKSRCKQTPSPRGEVNEPEKLDEEFCGRIGAIYSNGEAVTL